MATRTVTLEERQTGGALQFLWGAGVTIATFVAYIWDPSRALSYDASGSRGNFIATASLLDPFRRQVGYNNQVLFSFLEHVVYSAGFQSVSVLRVLPVTCAALTVGVMAGMTARWFGYLSSTVAVAVLALNPEFAAQGRDVRGYSLVALMAVLSTLCLIRWLRGAPRWIPYAYVATLVLAIGTNLFALGIVVVQVAVLLARREFTRPRVVAACSAVVLGLLPIIPLLHIMLGYDPRGGRRQFHAHFPIQEVKTALGVASVTGYTAVALFVAIPVLIGLLWVLRHREGRAAVGAVLVLGFGAWIVAPAVLAPRFFDWTLPGIAFLASAGTWRVRASALVLPGIVVLSVLQFQGVNAWDVQRYAWTQAAAFANSQAANGHPVCVPQTKTEDDPFVGYTHHFILVENAQQLRGCHIVLQITENATLLSEIESQYTLQKYFPAWFPTGVWVRH